MPVGADKGVGGYQVVHITTPGCGGGGYSVWKRVPTVDRMPWSCGCCEQIMRITTLGFGEGGGYSVWKRVPTVDRMLQSCGCREQTMLKKGGCPVIINDYSELSNMFILGFYIKLHIYAFKVVQETLQHK